MSRPKIAIVHPRLLRGGGSEACTVWMLRALQDESRLTLITTGRPDLELLSRAYGAELNPAAIDSRFVPVPPGMERRFDALRSFRLSRYCRRHAADYDVMISAYNVMDFGRPGIQRIGDFSFDDRLRRTIFPKQGAAARFVYEASPLRSAYLWLGRRMAGTSRAGWKRNRTIANSEWTRRLLKTTFDLESEVIYPPVPGDFQRVPWDAREDGFVVMGRLVPEKGIDLVVDILREIRKEKDVHLHILGRADDSGYVRRIETLARQNRDWMFLEGAIYGPEKTAFLARHKYGLSGCRHEAFGVAVAEMVKSGCLVWVPEGGGQVEIVAHPDLIYYDKDQAVRKILDVLRDDAKASALRHHLESRAQAFSAEHFVRAIQNVTRRFLEESHAA